MDLELIKKCEAEAQKWLSPAFDAETQAEVKAMLEAEDKTALSMHSIRTSNSVQVVSVASWVLVPTV